MSNVLLILKTNQGTQLTDATLFSHDMLCCVRCLNERWLLTVSIELISIELIDVEERNKLSQLVLRAN